MTAMKKEHRERLDELFKAYAVRPRGNREEIRYQASELGKELFKEKTPPDRIVGMYIETIRHLTSDETTLKTLRWEDLLIEMMMSYSVGFLEAIELKEKIRMLANFTSENPNPTLRIAKDGTIIYANVAALSILNEWKREVGQPAPDRWRRMIAEVLSSTVKKEVEVEHRDRAFSFVLAPITEADYVNLYGHDITQRKEVEEKLREYREHLESLVKERTAELEAFAYSVSHDLRAPLRAMHGFSQALLEDYGDRFDVVGREYAHRIVDAAHRMDTMIRDLLEYSRISRAEIQLGSVGLGSVVEDVLNQLQAVIREKDAQVTVEKPLPPVIGHRVTLMMIVTNLLTNAIKFMAPGVRPEVRLWAEARGGWVRLWVEDNGIGIPPEHQERVFRVFERLHGGETYPGTGIGLAIVRKGMDRMGGQVGVESVSGQGSKFWIELPEGEVRT